MVRMEFFGDPPTVPVGDPFQIHADRFSGHYGMQVCAGDVAIQVGEPPLEDVVGLVEMIGAMCPRSISVK